jgi:hypothetical protein
MEVGVLSPPEGPRWSMLMRLLPTLGILAAWERGKEGGRTVCRMRGARK